MYIIVLFYFESYNFEMNHQKRNRGCYFGTEILDANLSQHEDNGSSTLNDRVVELWPLILVWLAIFVRNKTVFSPLVSCRNEYTRVE